MTSPADAAQTLTITGVSIDGEGVGHGAGAVDGPRGHDDAGRAGARAGGPVEIRVAGALPGETVRAVVEHRSPHRPLAWARLVEITTPSPERVQPACPAFGACGGCALMHWDPAAQAAWKRQRVEAALGRVLAPHGVAVDATVVSPSTLGYRNHAKLVAGRDPSGRLVLGAFAPRSHAVVDLAGCRVVEAPLAEVADAVRDALDNARIEPFDERARTGQIRYVLLRRNHRGQVRVVLVGARAEWPEAQAVADDIRRRHPAVVSVVHNVNSSTGNRILGDDDRALVGAPDLDENLAGVPVRLAPAAFLQANRAVATLAYRALTRAVAVRPGEHAVDAYAGVGVIGRLLAEAGARVVAIEVGASAVAAAAASVAGDGGAVTFRAVDAGRGLAELEHADVVVLNPPRKGCDREVLRQVVRLGPRVIAYLSCDPDSLARDLEFLDASGFVPRSVTPFDMLPHTPHIETLVVLDGPGTGGAGADRLRR